MLPVDLVFSLIPHYIPKITWDFIVSIDNLTWSPKTKPPCEVSIHLEDTEAQREVTNLQSSNLKSRLLSPNHIFLLLITALHSSQQVMHKAGNLTRLSTDLPPDSIVPLTPANFALFQ